jgi:hypothetical protein
VNMERRLDVLETHAGCDEPDLLAIRVMRVDVAGNRSLARTIYCDPIRGGVIRIEPGHGR